MDSAALHYMDRKPKQQIYAHFLIKISWSRLREAIKPVRVRWRQMG